MKRKRGVTLLEVLIAATLLTVVALFTMRALGQSRILRGNARAQETMLLLAQEELERLRATPAGELAEGTTTHRGTGWPEKMASTVTLDQRDDGTWLIDVTVDRPAIEGLSPVRLTTIRRGEQ